MHRSVAAIGYDQEGLQALTEFTYAATFANLVRAETCCGGIQPRCEKTIFS